MTAGVCRKGQLGTLKGDLRSIVEAVFAASNRAAELTFLVARGLSLRRVGDTAYFGAMMQDTGIIVLQRNNGNGTYSDVAHVAGVDRTDWSWAPLFVDLDNDGWKDLFVTNGIARDVGNNDFRDQVR